MAEVNININTESNTLEVLVDGKKLPNVVDASAYLYKNYKDQDVVDFRAFAHEVSDGGLMKCITYALSGGATASAAINNGIEAKESAVASIVSFSDNVVAIKDIQDFFKG